MALSRRLETAHALFHLSKLAVWWLRLPPLIAVLGQTLSLIVSGGTYIAIASRLIARVGKMRALDMSSIVHDAAEPEYHSR